ncbi:hypothetical protein SMACR_04183 [Sordaria macrospora]|uniref:Myb-like domain-containing protein n=1 Tax=Sordaria macrospora TaxID=5147 RepID=A0A8S8ZEB3_SORMA|nr:hypothetical protein SMACR_04183 [Sordaria macrospora]WPJ64479.1 hypothetical protein SMAC4_04183 [Sordaria macrospora]
MSAVPPSPSQLLPLDRLARASTIASLTDMNKNWNDRADKDLFFTILNVKNIGVISGSEWITIGNTMRAMGYGFTNEGCRQHFQGLRRAQHKSEGGAATASPDPNRRMDPTMNPITRRPGPGRGRPKKQQNTAQGQSPTSTASVSETGTTGPSVTPIPPPVVPGAPSQSTTAIPVPVVPGMPAPPAGMHSAAAAQAQAHAQAQQAHAQHFIQAQLQAQAQVHAQHAARTQQNGRGGNQAGGQGPANQQGVQAQSGGQQSANDDDVAVDPSLEDGDDDQHQSKRRKVEQDPLDDAAVMNALAAHNDPASNAAHFSPE